MEKITINSVPPQEQQAAREALKQTGVSDYLPSGAISEIIVAMHLHRINYGGSTAQAEGEGAGQPAGGAGEKAAQDPGSRGYY